MTSVIFLRDLITRKKRMARTTRTARKARRADSLPEELRPSSSSEMNTMRKSKRLKPSDTYSQRDMPRIFSTICGFKLD